MKNAVTLAALAALTVGLSTQAQSALLEHNGSITSANLVGSVDYYGFSTNASGNVRLETFDADFDTMLWLFPSQANLVASDTIAGNDDDGTEGNSSFGFSNSLINVNLEAGDYVAAVGDYFLSIAEAISGINDSSSLGAGSGNYRLEVDGLAVVDPSTVPVIGPGNGPKGQPSSNVSEPMTLGLFGLAMAGFGAFRRKKV